MVVVFEDDAPARAHGVNHRADSAQRIPQVFKEKARMRDVERSPFAGTQWQRQCVALTKFDQRLVAGESCLPLRLGNLFAASLNGDDAHAGGASHCVRQLAQTAADVEDALTAVKMQFAQ